MGTLTVVIDVVRLDAAGSLSPPQEVAAAHRLNNVFLSLRQPPGNSLSYSTQQKPTFHLRAPLFGDFFSSTQTAEHVLRGTNHDAQLRTGLKEFDESFCFSCRGSSDRSFESSLFTDRYLCTTSSVQQLQPLFTS